MLQRRNKVGSHRLICGIAAAILKLVYAYITNKKDELEKCRAVVVITIITRAVLYNLLQEVIRETYFPIEIFTL